METNIVTIIKQIALRDLETKFVKAQIGGAIIPDLVFEIMKDLEYSYTNECDVCTADHGACEHKI